MLQEHWATALKTLTLSLDEVVHIRSVLTKAELEGLPLDGDLKDDVAKGKVSRIAYLHAYKECFFNFQKFHITCILMALFLDNPP